MSIKYAPGLYSGRFFESAEAAALQFQYSARLRSANSRDKRFSTLHRAQMQRESAEMYAAARDAIAKAEGQQ